MSEMDSLRAHVERWYEWSRRGQKLWSFVHHSFLFGSVVAGLLAAAVLQVLPDFTGIPWDKDKIAATLSLAAAVLAGVAATGGFERKWRINRLSRSRLEMLLIDLEAPETEPQAARETLKKIIAEHDSGIVGSDGAADK